jgi:hypothetical protein
VVVATKHVKDVKKQISEAAWAKKIGGCTEMACEVLAVKCVANKCSLP